MLPKELKESIQTAYKQLLEDRSLTPRSGQRRMIAEIANSLAVLGPGEEPAAETQDGEAGRPICVVEAGTGTGKTLAYILAVAPLAQAFGYKVVLSTATIALQEQVIYKDLPDIVHGSGLRFSFTLAKGRGRYLCLSKLDMLLGGNDSLDAIIDLFGAGGLAEPPNTVLYQQMLEEITAGKWNGDRDEWTGAMPNADWIPLTADNAQCSGPRCTNFSRCFFYKARQSMEAADIIVTNHDLVLSDLALGGGVILPEPEKTIYIFDEAHHLPIKSTNHFASFARIRGSIASLEQCTRVMRQLENSAALGSAEHPRRLCRDLADSTAPVIESLNELWLLLQDFVEPADSRDEFDRGVHCFPLGVVPAGVQQSAAVLSEQFSQLSTRLDQLNSLLKDNMEDGESILARQEAEQWYAAVGSLCGRIDKALGLWRSFAHTDPAGEAPTARWLKPVAVGTSEDISLSASPVLAARNLQENLWERCAGAVLTSATLSALGNFDLLNMRAGLPSGTRYFRIPSPFDYQQAAALVIPKLNCLPGDPRHTEVITLAIPQILDRQSAALMLFSSRRQMLDVLSGLTAEWRELVLCQDDYQKTQLLAYHRQRIDRGEGSVIFGLASFAEGVDLPGKYCTHVLIAKIPFAVPDDPIEATLADWLTSQSKNPFMTLSVPEAALRLVQSSGRLLRSETDTGLITLFDERIVSKFYGRSILESLPPYRREVFRQQYDLPEAVRSMN